MSIYTNLVKKPAPAYINTGLSAMKTSKLIALFGQPRKSYSQTCMPITNTKLKRRIVTASVGPFRVTGMDIAVESLKGVFADIIRAGKADLYGQIGTAGMLCVRFVRGSDSTLSNHSFGLAVDLTIGGILDRRGDNKVQQGLLDLYPYFHRHGWYWGAEYSTEDGMHWELSWEKFLELNAGR